MDIKHIEYVLEAAKTGSLGSAAQNLYLSQPNLSYAIRSLEDELGSEIFSRTNRGVELTDFGRQFLMYAAPVYGQYRTFEVICDILQKRSLSFSLSSSPLKFVSNTFVDFYKRYQCKDCFMSYREGNLDSILNEVENATSDIGVVIVTSYWQKTFYKLLQLKDLEYHKISDEDPYVIVSEHNPLYHLNPPSVTLDDMGSYCYITADTGTFGVTEQKDLYKYNCRVAAYNRACFYDILLQTDAYSITSHNTNAYREKVAYPGIRAIPLKFPGLFFEIGWIKKNAKTLSKIEREFVDELYRCLSGEEQSLDEAGTA